MSGTSRIRRPRHRDLDGIGRGRLDRAARDLSVSPNPQFVNRTSATHTFTANNTTNQLTVAGEDALADGFPRVVLNGDDLAEPLQEGAIYFLRDAGTNLYTLHPTREDALNDANAVDLSDDGTGTQELTLLD